MTTNQDLLLLHKECRKGKSCELSQTRNNVVVAKGNSKAKRSKNLRENFILLWKIGFIAGQYIFSKKSLILLPTAAYLATLNAQFQYNEEKLSDKSNYCVQEKWNKLFAL